MSIMQVWFSFNGRINRSTFWLKGILGGSVCLAVVGVVVGVVVFGLGGLDVDEESPWPSLVLVYWIAVLLVFWIAVLLAVWAKRWHDHDMSGWWTAGVCIPIIGYFFSFYMFFKLGFLKGTDGPNRYGPAP